MEGEKPIESPEFLLDSEDDGSISKNKSLKMHAVYLMKPEGNNRKEKRLKSDLRSARYIRDIRDTIASFFTIALVLKFLMFHENTTCLG